MCTGLAAEGRVLAVRESRPVRRTVPVGNSAKHDFACAYETAINPEDGRSSEEWARAAWEDAPAPLRWFMVAGWRFVLGLRLGPQSSPDHILGWQIFERDPNTTACQLHSGFLAAVNIFHRAEGRFTWSTFVTYDRPIARVVWPPVSVIHRLLVRLALRRVANS